MSFYLALKIDLTYGRFDHNDYPLFRTLETIHRDDFHNACSDVLAKNGPRQPWHDIHARIQGPGTLDLIQNFEERWIGQGGSKDELASIEDSKLKTTCEGKECGNLNTSWHSQLYRSIDDHTASFQHEIAGPRSLKDNNSIEFENKHPASNRLDSSKDGSLWRSKWQSRWSEGSRKNQTSTSSTSTFLHVPSVLQFGTQSKHYTIPKDEESDVKIFQPLDRLRCSLVDSSAHKALIYHIRQAEHVVYIESQYFLSSSHVWYHHRSPCCCNKVAAELTYKICQKIAKGERFSTYIVIPMWPEGLPDSTAVQDILGYQANTIEFMYRKIHRAIRRKRKTCKGFASVKPTDYLSFYCLANRETREGGQDMEKGSLLNYTRRHLIYVVSAGIFADVCCGEMSRTLFIVVSKLTIIFQIIFSLDSTRR